MDIGKGIGDAIDGIMKIAVVGVICTVVLGLYTVYSVFFSDDVYETKELVVPDIHVTTVNGVSDTTYVYTF